MRGMFTNSVMEVILGTSAAVGRWASSILYSAVFRMERESRLRRVFPRFMVPSLVIAAVSVWKR